MTDISRQLIVENFALYMAESIGDALNQYAADVLRSINQYPWDENNDYILCQQDDQTIEQMISHTLQREPVDISFSYDKLPRVYATELTPDRWLIWSTWQLNLIKYLIKRSHNRV